MDWQPLSDQVKLPDNERVVIFYPCYKEPHLRHQMIDAQFLHMSMIGGATHYCRVFDPI